MPMRKGINFDFLFFGRKRAHTESKCARARESAHPHFSIYRGARFVSLSINVGVWSAALSFLNFDFLGFLLLYLLLLLFLFFCGLVIIIVMVLKWSTLFRSNRSRLSLEFNLIAHWNRLAVCDLNRLNTYRVLSVLCCGRPRADFKQMPLKSVKWLFFFRWTKTKVPTFNTMY